MSAPAAGDVAVTLAGERVVLLPERALWRPRRAQLLVADTHWGKGAAFRAAGLPVPAAALVADLARLTSALDRTDVRELVVLGDLLHAARGRTPEVEEAVGAWRARHPSLSVRLVRGNHDRHAGDPPKAWRMAVVDGPLVDAPFVLRHEVDGVGGGRALGDDAGDGPAAYVLGGHVHPVVTLHGPGGDRLRLPAFILGPRAGLLPAFGGFTGGAEVRPSTEDRVYVVADDAVLPVLASMGGHG